ncbi:MAG TPA: TlpA disulfide reductase family protein [Bacteroidales bacterium]|nr:TlpA disulfide reductase family protein [Bacteroidales bacterium]
MEREQFLQNPDKGENRLKRGLNEKYSSGIFFMKKWLFLIAAALIFAACKPAAKEATISGVVNNPTGEKVDIFYFKHLVGNPMERIEVTLDANNAFSATLPLTEGQFVHIRVPRRNVMLYLAPGAKVNVTLDETNPDAAPVVEGEGALESQFLVSYAIEVERKHNRAIVLNMAGYLSAEEFLDTASQGYNDKMTYLENHENFRKFDKDFVSLMQTNFLYEKYNLLLEYPMAFSYFNPDAGEPQLPEGFYSFLENEGLFSDQYAKSRPYFRFLQLYLNRKMEETGDANSDLSFAEQMFNLAEKELPGLSREMVLAEMVIMGLGFMELDAATALHNRFMAVASNPSIIDIVLGEYDAVMALAPGQPAPQFTLSDIDGHPVSLSDYAGKVVYLDFWASWCGPCLREIPYAKELKKRLENETDLVFLYISVDTDEAAWRNAVAQHQIQGVHLNVPGFDHEVPKAYNLRGVPTFFLIGRDGKIINNRPPRPSNPQIDQVLKDALAL